MYREIKFRAWDKRTRKMIATGFYVLGETTCFDLIYDYCMKHGLRKGEVGLLRINSVVIMQYTGLKDKNGKEIYESDILKHDLWGIDIVIWDNEGSCFRGKSDERDMTLSSHQLNRTRVIGNKYENPELVDV